MKIFVVAIGSWVSGLATFVICSSGSWGIVGGDPGLLVVASLVAAAPTIGLLFLPVMLWLRTRAATRTLRMYVTAGCVLGLIPGAATAMLAGALANIDGAPKSPLALITSTPGLAGLAAGVVSGATCGVGLFAALARRKS